MYHCESFKLEVLASAKLQALRINREIHETGTKKEEWILKNKINSIIDLVREGI